MSIIGCTDMMPYIGQTMFINAISGMSIGPLRRNERTSAGFPRPVAWKKAIISEIIERNGMDTQCSRRNTEPAETAEASSMKMRMSAAGIVSHIARYESVTASEQSPAKYVQRQRRFVCEQRDDAA